MFLCFSPEFIISEYKRLRNDPKIKVIIETFKKHSSLVTLEDVDYLKRWLLKHTRHKPRFYFEECEEGFKLKSKWIEVLEKERIENNI